MAASVSACGQKYDFEGPPPPPDLRTDTLFDFFSFGKSTEEFKQDADAGPNKLTLQFKATDLATDLDIPALKATDLNVLENGVQLVNYSVDTATSTTSRKADIVFVIDDTSSMQPYIDEVKLKVSRFIADLKKTNIEATLCLVVFGDEVEQKCDSFVEDPTQNLANFLDQVSRIRAHDGGDIPENQLAALKVAAEKTPWHVDSQRIAILVSDADFHYAPDNIGDAVNPPTYAAALKSITSNRMQSFLLTISADGYNSDFNKSPSIAKASHGGWFDISDVLDGSVDMSDIFVSILNRLKVTYVLNYIADENPGVDPTTPLSKRVIAMTLRSGVLASFDFLSFSSNFPLGRPNYKSRFKLSRSDVDLASLEVYLNGGSVLGLANLVNGEIVFKQPPPPSSKIQIKYLYSNFRDNLKVHPILIDNLRSIRTIRVMANGHQLLNTDYSLKQVNGSNFIELSEALFSNDDTLEIKAKGGLSIEIFDQ